MMDCFSEYCSRNLVFCDVGARWGLEEPFKAYRDCVDVISFEPDQEEYEELSNKKMNRDLVLPYALYKEVKQINLNLTKSRGCSSIYEPNHAFLAISQTLNDLMSRKIQKFKQPLLITSI